MTDIQTVGAIVAIIVAVYGAGLSTYNFYDKRRDRQPRLVLGYRPGFFELGGGQLSETTMNLEVSNIGSKPVKIVSHSNVQILLPNGKYFVPMEDWQSNMSFPCILSPGSTLTVWRDIRAFAQSLKKNGLSGKVKFRVICHDGAGRVHMGKRLPFDIEAWAKSGQSK